MKLAVIGGGWAGLAAAVRATEGGHQVTLLELAGQLGGRARSVRTAQGEFDNGQHILIGAYVATLALMQTVGVDLESALLRTPLRVVHADGSGLAMPPGPAVPSFVRAVLAYRGWTWGERLALLRAAGGWALRGFKCPSGWTVGHLTRGLPLAIRRSFIDPLCVAALNTPSAQASAAVFLRVLRDALFSGPGASDLLVPRIGLQALLPEPAERWLRAHGACVKMSHRVQVIERQDTKWSVDGEPYDAVVLACSSHEAARLVAPLSPGWSTRASALLHEPIVTAYLTCEGGGLREAMVALEDDDTRPAQFAFDHGRLSGRPGLVASVASGASRWTARGLGVTGEAMKAQLDALPRWEGAGHQAGWRVLQVLAEKRATFLCLPDLLRPPMTIAPGLLAAGDYVDGPYPATLEGAVRSGLSAVESLGG